MVEYVYSALVVYTEKNEGLKARFENSRFKTKVDFVSFENLLIDPEKIVNNAQHIIIAGGLTEIKTLLSLAIKHNFSIGLIPDKSQKYLINSFGLPKTIDGSIELALQNNNQAIDLILCNDNILLFKATIGNVPLLDNRNESNKIGILIKSLKNSFKIKLYRFNFTTATGQKIKTVASGCIVLQRYHESLAAKLVNYDSSVRDGAISMLISSPISLIDYVKVFFRLLIKQSDNSRLPKGIGYIKSSQISIDTLTAVDVVIDDSLVIQTPLHCEVLPKAVRINVGKRLAEDNKNAVLSKESIRIGSLPNERELDKLSFKKIPFFSYVSEDRFRDLFISLRKDAKVTSIYIVLMVMSTLLATIGLYQSSTAVVIGAMLLAPLMTPIVSLSMGLLRKNNALLKDSFWKILIGVFLALIASALITQLFPHKPITNEMEARLSPTLLDLAVAIMSGIAGAYSKSHKEIIQSLAGVAIAVALVPPLSVAGIGIGRGDFDFFLQAFLLFSTNLVGITLSAALTFRVLGFSPLVYAKRGMGIIVLMSLIISVPLYLSYHKIVETMVSERNIETIRFLVNGKYILVNNVKLTYWNNKKIVSADILTRGLLDRKDLISLKKKIQLHFKGDSIIRIQIHYIL